MLHLEAFLTAKTCHWSRLMRLSADLLYMAIPWAATDGSVGWCGVCGLTVWGRYTHPASGFCPCPCSVLMIAERGMFHVSADGFRSGRVAAVTMLYNLTSLYG